MSIPNIKGNFFAELYNFYIQPIEFISSQFDKNGDQFKINMLHKNIICSRNPEWIEHIFVKNQKNYTKDFTMRQIEFILGKGLLTNTGDAWLQQRRLIQTAFYKGRLESLIEIMEVIIETHIAKLKKLPTGKEFFIDQEMLELTATVALETIFGEKMSADLRKVQHQMAEIQKFIVKRIKFPPYIALSYLDGEAQKTAQKLKEIDKIIYQIIEKRKRKRIESFNLVSLLLNAQDTDGFVRMTDKQLRDELVTFYFAGHETTAFALSWTFYELMQHPNVIVNIKNEVSAVIKNGRIGIDGLKQLVYTNAVVLESLRLHPPAYIISRESLGDDEIVGEKIKKGDMIIVSLWNLHRHPDWWTAPNEFNPERFLEKNSKNEQLIYPFGAGPRICIGKHFALMEIILVLSKVLSVLDFDLVSNQKIEHEALITLKPKNGIRLIKK